MGKKNSFDSEFPILSQLGLYAAPITGDGNCLFNAFSDQIYGDESRNGEIRERVVDHIRANKDHFSPFLSVFPGGATRRNPKRKTAGSLASVDNSAPSQADIDRQFDHYVANMRKSGTYGGNMEITAFSAAYDVHVKVWQANCAFMVESKTPKANTKPVAHIAYHDWEHYSSIRNIDGPHTGLPHVVDNEAALAIAVAEEKQKQTAKTSKIQPWMIKAVTQSLPYFRDEDTITRALQDAAGNIDTAVSRLLDAEERGSVSSAQGSSSIERDADSDDEALSAPNKRRQRSTVSASASQESIESSQSDDSRPVHSQSSCLVVPDSEDEDWPNVATRNSSVSAASPRQSPAPQPLPKLTLKLRQTRHDRSPVRKESPKTTVRPAGPQKRRGPTARERKDMKKQAQKQARKERAQAAVKGGPEPATTSELPSHPKPKKASPPIESGFRTLYI